MPNIKKIINPWLDMKGFCCPGCCPTNPKGLHLQAYEDGDDVVSFWDPDPLYQSWSNTLHGGIQCLLLDEMAGWVVIHKLSTIAVTSKMETKYLKQVTIDGGKLETRARLSRMMRNVAFIDAEIIQGSEVCTKAQIIYFCSPKEIAKKRYGFTGCQTMEVEKAE